MLLQSCLKQLATSQQDRPLAIGKICQINFCESAQLLSIIWRGWKMYREIILKLKSARLSSKRLRDQCVTAYETSVWLTPILLLEAQCNSHFGCLAWGIFSSETTPISHNIKSDWTITYFLLQMVPFPYLLIVKFLNLLKC